MLFMGLTRNEATKGSVIFLMILVVSALHFQTGTEHRYFHEVYQRAYYIPILLAAFWFGPWIGLATAFLTSLIYTVHIEKDWTQLPTYAFNQYAEIVLYHVTALIIGFLASRERRLRRHLEKTSRELSEAYQRLQETFEQLRRSDRLAALGQLSAGIAHEIRNPLSSIKGSIEILEEEVPADHPKNEFVGIIKDEVARLNSLINEFLQFARPPEPVVSLTSLNDVIDSTLTLITRSAEDSQVEIRTTLTPELPSVKLDPDQIRQVLLNVMLNSIQALPEGGLLEIYTGAHRDSRKVTVEIKDEGVGIKKEDLDRIFDPFFSTRPEGTGLGLSVSHQLVENNGGTISVRDNPGPGVTFCIEFPASATC
jgi:signal transduction histidine kinase